MKALFPDSTFATPSIKDNSCTTAQHDSLVFIATQCPYEYGVGVYMARAMLTLADTVNYMVAHACEATEPPSARLSGGTEDAASDLTQSGSAISIYPNPARSLLTVLVDLVDEQIERIELMNYLGHRIQTTRLNKGMTEIDVSSLSSGVYHYSIIIDGVVKQTGKQVILK
ncbi:MAG: hypothetical protein ACI9YU_001206 [Flavobacteriales bacterium]|jgi:hypothetical protein